VDIEDISLNGNTFVSQVPGIIDTGTTSIVGPSAEVSKFYTLIPGSTLLPPQPNLINIDVYSGPCLNDRVYVYCF
jgi:hypothetical protein